MSDLYKTRQLKEEIMPDLYKTDPAVMGLYENRPNMMETMYDLPIGTAQRNYELTYKIC